jgi:hypothetical protein
MVMVVGGRQKRDIAQDYLALEADMTASEVAF